MSAIFRYACFLAGLIAPVLAPMTGTAAEPAPAVVLLELFTSQSCYSCPPAETLMRERYVHRAGVLVLEWHVDYWDDITYGIRGRWQDRFSNPEFTQRQRRYAKKLRQRSGVYTPQLVVQGRGESLGTRAGAIDRLITGVQISGGHNAVQFSIDEPNEQGRLARLITPVAAVGNAELMAVVFRLRETTEVPRGENHGKTLINSHVVTRVLRVPTERGVIQIPPIDAAHEGCAVWVQNRNGGIIRGAARCRHNSG